MKVILNLLCYSITYSQKLWGLIRQHDEAKVCLAVNNIAGAVENGEVTCAGEYCKLQCEPQYHFYGGPRKVRCKTSIWKGAFWPRELGSCKTCNAITINDNNLKKKCKTLNNGLRRCIFSCNNGVGIYPINKRRAITICKCNASSLDYGGKCRWRLGSKLIDDETKDDYTGKWYCENSFDTELDFDEDNQEHEGSEDILSSINLGPTHQTDTVLQLQTSQLSSTGNPNAIQDDQFSPFRIPPGLVCRPNSSDRIIGGLSALQNSWPWIARVKFGNFFCGGTIIDDNTVVTAGHCCRGFERFPNNVIVTIGDHDTNVLDQDEFAVKAKDILLHPDYNRRTLENDVCLVKAWVKKNFNLRIRNTAAAACLPQPGVHPKHGTVCWAAGWGKVDRETTATILQEVDLAMISDKMCDKTENTGKIIKDKMFCAGYLEGGKDGCQGDSGGPLICAVDGQPVLVGVTSWGYGCALKNSPGVWTKVSSYVDWIKKQSSIKSYYL